MKINISVTIDKAHRVWAIYYLLSIQGIPAKAIKKTVILDFLKSQIYLFGAYHDSLMGETDAKEIDDYLNGKIGNNGILEEAICLEYDLFQKHNKG